MIEVDFAIICACLPVCWPLIRKVLPKSMLISTTGGKSSPNSTEKSTNSARPTWQNQSQTSSVGKKGVESTVTPLDQPSPTSSHWPSGIKNKVARGSKEEKDLEMQSVPDNAIGVRRDMEWERNRIN